MNTTYRRPASRVESPEIQPSIFIGNLSRIHHNKATDLITIEFSDRHARTISRSFNAPQGGRGNGKLAEFARVLCAPKLLPLTSIQNTSQLLGTLRKQIGSRYLISYSPTGSRFSVGVLSVVRLLGGDIGNSLTVNCAA